MRRKRTGIVCTCCDTTTDLIQSISGWLCQTHAEPYDYDDGVETRPAHYDGGRQEFEFTDEEQAALDERIARLTARDPNGMPRLKRNATKKSVRDADAPAKRSGLREYRGTHVSGAYIYTQTT